MTYTSKDPIVNVVYEGIKRGIRVALDNQCYGSAVILILSGMDTMAYLGMLQSQQDVRREDFVNWAKRYMQFPCAEQLSGDDLYGARCGILHSYSSVSRRSRQGRCRQIGYMDQSVPEVRYAPHVSRELVLVSLPALAEAFLGGLDRFLVDLFSDTKRAPVAERRFKRLVHTIPYGNLAADRES